MRKLIICTVQQIRLRRMRLAGHRRDKRQVSLQTFLSVNLKRGDHLGDLDIDERIILK
jgi:hypothetical protein